MSRLKKEHFFAPLLLCLFAIVVSVRLPNVILEGGRLWAEEGVIYFHNAWYLPWYKAWFAIHTGYLNFAAAFGTWAGLRIGGIRYAPTVTVFIALVIQCLPVYIITTHDFPWRRSIFLTTLAAFMCALPPLTSEVWLNTITSQFHLALCAALIFASPSSRPAFFFIDCAILFVGSFSGPGTCFLLPFFVLTAAFTRDRNAIVKAAIVCFGFAAQFLVYFLHDRSIRGDRLNFDELLSVISLHTIILQFTGFTAASLAADYITAAYAAQHILWAGPLIFFSFYGVLACAIWRTGNVLAGKLLCAGILISLVSFYEALNGDFHHFMSIGFGERYAFIPMAINGLVIVALTSSNRRFVSAVSSLALCLIVFIGVADYGLDKPYMDHGPPWRPQFSAWRLNSNKALFVWPDKNWPTGLTANHVLRPDLENQIHHMRR